MTYRLVSQPGAVPVLIDGPLTLVDVDLARHVRDVGYWKRPAGTVISGSAKGAHLEAPGEGDPVALAKSVEARVAKASALEPGTPEHAQAWTDIANDLDKLSDKAKAAAPPKDTWTNKKPVKTAKEGGKGFAEHMAIGGAIIPGLIAVGNKVTAGAAGLLTGEESSHFAHAFEELAHNPLVEAGIWVGLALLLHALAVRLKAALKKRKADKIEKARETLGTWKSE